MAAILSSLNGSDTAKWIDEVARPTQMAVRRVFRRSKSIGNFLHGKWLGHPLHSAVTDIPIGAWTAAVVMDGLGQFSASKKLQPGADCALAIGIGGAVLAALSGAADWAEVPAPARRLGFVHGATNAVIAGLMGGSLVARKLRMRPLGVALASTGFLMTIFSSWLGGELVYALGVGVREEAKGAKNAIAANSMNQKTIENSAAF